MHLRLLRVMPAGLGHLHRGFGCEVNLDVVSFIAAEDALRISKELVQIEVSGHIRRYTQQLQGFESVDAVGSRPGRGSRVFSSHTLILTILATFRLSRSKFSRWR
jgi:hypothetical protein